MANWPACAAGVWAQSMFAGVLMISLLYSTIESSILLRVPKLPLIAISSRFKGVVWLPIGLAACHVSCLVASGSSILLWYCEG